MLVVVEVDVLRAAGHGDFVAGTVMWGVNADEALAVLGDVDWFVFGRVVRVGVAD